MLVLKMGYRSHVARFEISDLNLYTVQEEEKKEVSDKCNLCIIIYSVTETTLPKFRLS
jgi:hypothetical protein